MKKHVLWVVLIALVLCFSVPFLTGCAKQAGLKSEAAVTQEQKPQAQAPAAVDVDDQEARDRAMRERNLSDQAARDAADAAARAAAEKAAREAAEKAAKAAADRSRSRARTRRRRALPQRGALVDAAVEGLVLLLALGLQLDRPGEVVAVLAHEPLERLLVLGEGARGVEDAADALDRVILAHGSRHVSDLAYQASRPLLTELGAENSDLNPASLTALLVTAQPQFAQASLELDQALRLNMYPA